MEPLLDRVYWALTGHTFGGQEATGGGRKQPAPVPPGLATLDSTTQLVARYHQGRPDESKSVNPSPSNPATATKTIGIVAHSAEGASLCFLTACHEGGRPLGPHMHPTIVLSAVPMALCMDGWEHSDYGDRP